MEDKDLVQSLRSLADDPWPDDWHREVAKEAADRLEALLEQTRITRKMTGLDDWRISAGVKLLDIIRRKIAEGAPEIEVEPSEWMDAHDAMKAELGAPPFVRPDVHGPHFLVSGIVVKAMSVYDSSDGTNAIRVSYGDKQP